MTVRLQFVGGGKMGQALLGGLVSGWGDPHEFHIADPSEEIHQAIRSNFPGVSVSASPQAGVDTVLAVKPHLVTPVAQQLDRPSRVLSIAAGIPISAIEASVPDGTPVLRAMPNTPALHGLGASAVARGTNADEADEEWAVSILSAAGIVETVAEAELDAVTGLSGSGPAYVFLLAEALVDAGIAVGLQRHVAYNLATQTILGAGHMLRQEGADPVALRAAVTTPGGTTAAGIASFEAHDLRSIVEAAVQAATARSEELGKQ